MGIIGNIVTKDQAVTQIQDDLKKLTHEELLEFASQAYYHLRVVTGSRNSFHPDIAATIYQLHPLRTDVVENMQQAAAEFVHLQNQRIG